MWPYLRISPFVFKTQVDFDAPLGYKEPERPVQHEESIVSGFLEFLLINHVCDIYTHASFCLFSLHLNMLCGD